MKYRELFQSVRMRPMLHGLDGTYGAGVAFVLGCDAATSGALLSGFKEWLVVRLDDGNNLSWPGLAQRVIDVESDDSMQAGTPDDDTMRFDRLFQLLDEFLEQRDQRNGVIRIYSRYIEWLKGQPWFRQEMLQ